MGGTGKLAFLVIAALALPVCACQATLAARPAIDPRVTVYVAHLGPDPPVGDTVTPIDAATNTAGVAIKVGRGPAMMAVTPNGKTVLVLNSGVLGGEDNSPVIGHTVTPISTVTDTAGAPIHAGGTPITDSDVGIAVTPNGKTAWVSNGLDATVTPFSVITGKTGDPVAVGDEPGQIVITADGRTAYVADDEGVSVLDLSDRKVVKTIPVPPAAAMALTPDGATLYVVCYDQHEIVPVSTATDKAGRPIKLRGILPYAIAFTPAGKTGYVLAGGSLVVFKTATNTIIKKISIGSAGDPFLAIAITADGKTAYVAGEDPARVMVISTATNTVSKTIGIGPADSEPADAAIALTPDGATVYVTDTAAGSVIPISTASNTAGKPIKVGRWPSAIVIARS